MLGLEPSQNAWYLVLGPNEAQGLNVSSQKEFSERQVIGKTWIYSDSERSDTPQAECGPSQRASAAVKCGVVSFYGVGNFMC